MVLTSVSSLKVEIFFHVINFVRTLGEKRVPMVLSKWVYNQNWIYTALLFLHTGRIYKCLFTGSVSSLLTLPLDILSTWVLKPFDTSNFSSQITVAMVALELHVPFFQLRLFSSIILCEQLPITPYIITCIANTITVEIISLGSSVIQDLWR